MTSLQIANNKIKDLEIQIYNFKNKFEFLKEDYENRLYKLQQQFDASMKENVKIEHQFDTLINEKAK
ncbi:MAG: hypothetical protein RSB76_02060, partial [Clostridia bacterium]